MRILIYILVIISPVQIICGQGKSIKISDKLQIIQLSPQTYIHICEGSNGLVTVSNGEGIIVSTPPTDDATIQLLDWVKNSLKVKVTGLVVDSWHPDNMEGLDVFQARGIQSYANEMTRKIAAKKGLPVPQYGFNQKTELKVGNRKVILQYFGPAHTEDGIVVWLPDEKILFGSNAVRNYNGWVGNVGDANLDKWSQTIEKVKAEFGSAKCVVPGHGNFGGAELLDYTIDLYKPVLWGNILRKHDIKPVPVFDDYGKFFVTAKNDSVADPFHFLSEAIVFVDKGKQYLMIESSNIKFNLANKSIESDIGRIRILNKTKESSLSETDGYYKKLMVNLRDDAVEMTIIMKEFIR